MTLSAPSPDEEYSQKLKGLMSFRVLFAFLLGGSMFVYRLWKPPPAPTSLAVLMIYGLAGLILALSFLYFFLFRYFGRKIFFTYLQLGMDAILTTFIIMVTGSFASVFSFMYLLIIICSSILLFRKGSFILASFCSAQYALLIGMEYAGYMTSFGMDEDLARSGWLFVLFKVLAIIAACYVIAILSSFLAEREKRAREELMAMEAHVKRVEKTAAMGEMAAGLAHEIKNPLASMTGAIQLLQEDKRLEPDKAKLMRIVLREADRLSTLVSDFLQFARPVVGKPTRIRLDNALNDIVALFEKDSRCREKVRFVVNTIPNIWILMDPGHLQQVFWNLFLNAVEAVDENGQVTLNMILQKTGHVCIEVVDNGHGMDKTTLDSIFDPFFTTRSKGTGLGLSIVQRILDEYDSRLDVESKPGHGTKFILKLKQVASPIGDPTGA
ncbi:MAG: two-component system sensor histidine kinase NtrB [Thermodesulfobacteriota bacterium]